MIGSWFPLQRGLVNDEKFKSLPSGQRLCYLVLVSEYNLRGGSYKSDQEIAATISTSVDTVRRARKKFIQWGWIKTRPGFKDRSGRGLATTYLDVKYAKVEKGKKSGIHFARIHRFAFEALLFELRNGNLTHKNVLMFFYVCYFHTRYGMGGEEFFISKRELVELTGISGAAEAVLELGQSQIFDEDITLYDIKDCYHKIKIIEYRRFADPEINENNRKRAEMFKEDIKARVEKAKNDQASKKSVLQNDEALILSAKP